MKRFLVATAAVAMACLTSASFAADQQLVDQVFTPSVQLGTFCSGEIISSIRDAKSGKVSTIVLTAKHCVKDEPKQIVPVNVAVHDDTLRKTGTVTYLADVLGMSYKSDLALLRLRDKDTLFEKVATVAPKDVKLEFAQDVVVISYPLGMSQTYTKGNLGFVDDENAFADVSQSTQFLRATPDVAPGSSGSSMFTLAKNDKGVDTYMIIGVTTGTVKGFPFFNFFTPPSEIGEYLETAKTSFAWDSSGTAIGSPSVYH